MARMMRKAATAARVTMIAHPALDESGAKTLFPALLGGRGSRTSAVGVLSRPWVLLLRVTAFAVGHQPPEI